MEGMTELEIAKKMYLDWLTAESAVTTGQSYSIGTRSLTRANLTEIRKSIIYWKNEMAKLEAKATGRGRRAMRFMPRDL